MKKEFNITNHFQVYNPFELASHEKEYKNKNKQHNNVLSTTSFNYYTV